jgi:hypothetical protein
MATETIGHTRTVRDGDGDRTILVVDNLSPDRLLEVYARGAVYARKLGEADNTERMPDEIRAGLVSPGGS